MSTNQISPAEQLKKDISEAQSDLSSIVSKSNLTSIQSEFSELDTTIANLQIRIQKIRDRKYAYNKINEQEAAEFQKQWAAKKSPIQNQITSQAHTLSMGLRPLEMKVTGLRPMPGAQANVDMVKRELDAFESRVSSAESSLRKLYEELKNEVEVLTSQLEKVESTLDLCDAASFGFLPGESVVMAVEGVWARDGKEDKSDPEGILYLTDQRLIFEQKQEIATKKVLFVTTERELVQQLLFEVPVVSIESVKATKQGLFKNEDWLELVFASGSFNREAKLHLNGQDSEEWQKLIMKVKTKEIDADRAFEVDKAAVEKVKSAPSICPNCGGTLSKPVLRGMDTITCEFCGNVIRL